MVMARAGMVFALLFAAHHGRLIAATTAPVILPAPPYAALADMSLRAPVIAALEIQKAERLKRELAPGLAEGKARFLITGNVRSLLRGSNGISASIQYIIDVKLGSDGKLPKLKKAVVLIFADRVAGRTAELRLIGPQAQIPWSSEAESTTRSILLAAFAKNAPPVVTGIARAFHVPGAVAGESESQIFLTTASGQPISLSILRRPGESPAWSVALGEMVDESAKAPVPDSFLWYRLACFLPDGLPSTSIATLTASDAQAAQADYTIVKAGLGTCNRTITP